MNKERSVKESVSAIYDEVKIEVFLEGDIEIKAAKSTIPANINQLIITTNHSPF